MDETYQGIAVHISNVIQELESEGLDIRIVGRNVRYMGCGCDLGFYFVAQKGKVQPETIQLAELAWDPATTDSVWNNVIKPNGWEKTWWTRNGEDMVGELDTIYEALVRFLENREWEG